MLTSLVKTAYTVNSDKDSMFSLLPVGVAGDLMFDLCSGLMTEKFVATAHSTTGCPFDLTGGKVDEEAEDKITGPTLAY